MVGERVPDVHLGITPLRAGKDVECGQKNGGDDPAAVSWFIHPKHLSWQEEFLTIKGPWAGGKPDFWKSARFAQLRFVDLGR